MSIAHVGGQSTGNHANSTTSIAVAFPGNITSGNLIVAIGLVYKPSSDAFVAGDLTKTSGTATIGTLSLDITPVNFAYNADTNFVLVGIWSAIVTGSGSCTLTLAGAPAGSFLLLALDEFSGSWDSLRVETSSTNTDGTNNTTPAHSGNATSAGAALFIGGVAIGSGTTTTITPDVAFTQIFEDQAGATDMVGSAIYQIVGTGTTDRAEWTLSGSGTWSEGYGAGVCVYREAAGAGSANDGGSFIGQVFMESNRRVAPNLVCY